MYWNKRNSILILPSPCDYNRSYPEIIEDWIANTPKKAANVGDKFRPTVANKIEPEVCLYFFPLDKHV